MEILPANPTDTPKREHSTIQTGGRIRPLTYRDLETLSDMAVRLFPTCRESGRRQQEELFKALYLENPMALKNGKVPSLIYENSDGKTEGFLGVIHRPMSRNGKPVVAAFSNHLMLDSTGRASQASVALIKTMLHGGQDFTYTDSSSDTSRFLWERCGGSTCWLQSVHYRHMLKPFSFVGNRIEKTWQKRMFYPLLKTGDLFCNRMPGSPFKFKKPRGVIENLTVQQVYTRLHQTRRNKSIIPEYTAEQLQWLVDTVQIEKRYGSLQAFQVSSWRGYPAGWAVYHQKRNGMCEVLHFHAHSGMQNLVFDALCYHAYQQGGVELSGRLEPEYFKRFGNKTTIFVPGRLWMMIHSNNPDVLLELQSGKAALSKIEGDLWLV